MKKLTLSMAVLAMAGVASAALLAPDGDFENGITFPADGPATMTAHGAGGNPGGYGQIDSTTGWGVFVLDMDLSAMGAVGGDTVEITYDIIDLANAGAGDANISGIKIESWSGTSAVPGAHISNTGDVVFDPTTGWQTVTFNYTTEATAGFLKFVPLSVAGGNVGYDNIGVVPEPATLGLVGLAGGALLFMRRRFRV